MMKPPHIIAQERLWLPFTFTTAIPGDPEKILKMCLLLNTHTHTHTHTLLEFLLTRVLPVRINISKTS